MSNPETLFSPGHVADPMPEGDAARQAVDSLRGYAYQTLAAALAWLDLSIGGKQPLVRTSHLSARYWRATSSRDQYRPLLRLATTRLCAEISFKGFTGTVGGLAFQYFVRN